MKAERKHELQHNELDDFLIKAGHFFRENALVLGIAVAVLVLAVVVYVRMFAPRSMSTDAGLWQEYFKALSDRHDFGENNVKQELQTFIDDQEKGHRDSEAAVLWAKLSLGNMNLSEGTRELFEDRERARDHLAEAQKSFESVEKHAGRNAELLDRARYGLGQVYESQGKAEEAVKYYKLVVKAAPESPLGKAAAKGERRLSLKSNQEFLAWFEKQTPIKKSPAGKLPFEPPSERPGFELEPLDGSNDAPITPGFKLPSKPSSESSDREKSEPEGPAKSNEDPTPEKKPDDQEPAKDEQPE